jgi:flavin reductase (DIM6/NTAB) family NADH-FMN oxidoreductase RutF
VELVHDAGDHELILGRVLDLGVSDATPLVFYRSGFATLTDVATSDRPSSEGRA